jgi:hypothetical protein
MTIIINDVNIQISGGYPSKPEYKIKKVKVNPKATYAELKKLNASKDLDPIPQQQPEEQQGSEQRTPTNKIGASHNPFANLKDMLDKKKS